MDSDGRSRRRDLLLANGAAVLLLVVVFLVGWRQEAAFGLAVLAILDILVLVRGWPGRSKGA